MKRYTTVKKFLSVLNNNDIAIFVGQNLCEEAFKYDREGSFYLLDVNELHSSLALGVAMCTDKRVFVFCNDGDFLREIGSAAQMAVSRCSNIFYVVLATGFYQFAGGQPTIFNEFPASKTVFANLGFLVNDYINYFEEGKAGMKSLKVYLERIKGPMAIIMRLEKGIRKNVREEISYSKQELTDRIMKFISDESLGTSLYIKPSNLFSNMEG